MSSSALCASRAPKPNVGQSEPPTENAQTLKDEMQEMVSRLRVAAALFFERVRCYGKCAVSNAVKSNLVVQLQGDGVDFVSTAARFSAAAKRSVLNENGIRLCTLRPGGLPGFQLCSNKRLRA